MSDGKRGVALVTGASEGIGRVIASHLAERGYKVAAAARSTDKLETLAEETNALPVRLDVTDPKSVRAAVNFVEQQFGAIDLLVNNAGAGGHSGVTWEYEPSEWWQLMEVNVRGTFLCCHAVLPGMVSRRSGRVVNVSSGAATFSIADDFDALINSSYMASKAAVNRFTEALAAETRSSGVCVFAISPGIVKTSMTRVIFGPRWEDPDFWSTPELAAQLIECIGSGDLDQFSGRYFHAASDDWRTMSGK
jgi:NAD(P)-dependent dehydrogenase (short-subunit alcohol dehydrogenase family)